MIRVCVAGAAGWTGGAVAQAVLDDPELALVGAVARRAAGQDLGAATLTTGSLGTAIYRAWSPPRFPEAYRRSWPPRRTTLSAAR